MMTVRINPWLYTKDIDDLKNLININEKNEHFNKNPSAQQHCKENRFRPRLALKHYDFRISPCRKQNRFHFLISDIKPTDFY